MWEDGGETVRLEILANGLGSQSMWLLALAIRQDLPATVSITADTGSEQDRLWSTGERSTAREYYERIVEPLCNGTHVVPRFVRALDKDKQPLPALIDHLRSVAELGKFRSAKIPLFGSRGGKLRQVCTDKWKVRAIRQEARRLGATHLNSAQGIHFGEAKRRIKGRFIGKLAGWSTYQDTVKRNGEESVTKWCTHYYPLIDMQLARENIVELLDAKGIPYLISSECDMCPWKDLPRWERTSPDKLVEIASLESLFNGEFFFTDKRVPLMRAIEEMRKEPPQQTMDFGCGNHHCGV
jgi:hypothetical protein